MIYYFGQILRLFEISSPVGKKNFSLLNINSLVAHPDCMKTRQSLNRIFILQKKVTQAYSGIRKSIRQFFFHRTCYVSMVESSEKPDDFLKGLVYSEVLQVGIKGIDFAAGDSEILAPLWTK